MAKLFTSLLTTLYWPVVGFFVLAAIIFTISFFTTIEHSATGNFYNTRSLKMIAFLVGMLAVSIVMKQRGNIRGAHMVLYVPFGLVLLSVAIFFFIAYGLGKGK